MTENKNTNSNSAMGFTFTFKGELLKNAKRDDVIKKLAALFQCLPHEVAPLLNGDAIFERKEIDKLTAQAYAAQFNKLGAQGFITQPPRNHIQVTNKTPVQQVMSEKNQDAR